MFLVLEFKCNIFLHYLRKGCERKSFLCSFTKRLKRVSPTALHLLRRHAQNIIETKKALSFERAFINILVSLLSYTSFSNTSCFFNACACFSFRCIFCSCFFNRCFFLSCCFYYFLSSFIFCFFRF